MLDSVYAGDASNRCPYLILVASALAPKPPNAASLMRSAGLAAVQGAAQELAQARANKAESHRLNTQTTSFNDFSIEAGILLRGDGS